MTGTFLKRKIGKIIKWIQERPYYIRRFWNRKIIRKRDFTIISNNCWAGTVYQYLNMPYLSPTVGLYFFAEDYIKFVSNLRYYLSIELEFISYEDSRYKKVLMERNHTQVPIALLDDVEIIFLHYKTKEEAKEKWERRKQRVNYDNILLKFSNMNLCSEAELEKFDRLPFDNKFMLNINQKTRFKSELFWCGESDGIQIISDTSPFPGNLRISKLIRKADLYRDNNER